MRGWRAILTGVIIGGAVAGCAGSQPGASSGSRSATPSSTPAAARPSSGGSPSASASGAAVYLQSSALVAFTGDVVALKIQQSAGSGSPQWIRLTRATVSLGDGTTATASQPCTGASLPPASAGLVIRHAYRQAGVVSAQVTAVSSCGRLVTPDLSGATASMRVLPAAPSASASWPHCGVNQVAVTAIGTGAGLGHVGVLFTLSNFSSAGCRLLGYPVLRLLGERGQALPTTVVRAVNGAYLFPAVAPHWVALPPGGTGSFDVQYGDNPVGAQASEPYATACPTASHVAITLPDATDHTVVPAHMAPCGGQLLVSPVVPGSQWLGP